MLRLAVSEVCGSAARSSPAATRVSNRHSASTVCDGSSRCLSLASFCLINRMSRHARCLEPESRAVHPGDADRKSAPAVTWLDRLSSGEGYSRPCDTVVRPQRHCRCKTVVLSCHAILRKTVLRHCQTDLEPDRENPSAGIPVHRAGSVQLRPDMPENTAASSLRDGLETMLPALETRPAWPDTRAIPARRGSGAGHAGRERPCEVPSGSV